MIAKGHTEMALVSLCQVTGQALCIIFWKQEARECLLLSPYLHKVGGERERLTLIVQS